MKVHYFQRYSEKENVATSNTMLLLSRLYHYSSDKFFKFLKSSYFDDDNFEPEIQFNIQEKSNNSVPDATITQDSFKIVIETKLTDWFHIDQLINHLEAFNNENYKILLTLSSEYMADKKKVEFNEYLKEYNQNKIQNKESPVIHINTTFEDIVKNIQDVLDDVLDYEMIEILDDFFEYCLQENLIQAQKASNYMRMQLSGTTLNLNLSSSLYYDKEKRGFGDYGYLGLYKEKSIRAIGKIEKRIIAYEEDGEIKFTKEKGEITTDDKNRILKAIDDAALLGQDLKCCPHIYFFV